MHVEKVTLRNVLRHADTTLELPTAGVVALTGDNGHGKSSLIEAVSVALWGTTLRGTTPWSAPDGHVYARVRLGRMVLHVTRTVAKGRERLSFHAEGDEPVAYETTSKAQAALERLVGAHAVWRRASVFSSSDADSFSGATDGERKRMLESVLGVDRFEPALKACRLDVQTAEHAVALAEKDHALMLERLEAARLRGEDAQRAREVAEGEEPEPLEARARELGALLRQTDADVATARARLRDGDKAGAEHAAVARQLHQALERLRGATCPTCAQAISDGYRARLTADQQAASARAAEAAEAARLSAAAIEADLAELAHERDALVGKVAEVEGRLRAATRARRQRAQAEAVARDAAAAIALGETKAAAAHAALMHAAADVRELRACEKVLGLRGPRAQIVARALGGLEAVTNAWLGRVAGDGLSVRLAPFTETKTAGVADKIAFDVLGAGGGHGYRATSGGERRRLDVALLLALGEFVAAANGREVGTLFADEVFDALDAGGRAAVAAVLHELAREGRCIVVVTHLPAFVRELAPDAAWQVERGALVRA